MYKAKRPLSTKFTKNILWQYAAVHCMTVLVAVSDPHGSASFWEAVSGYASASKPGYETMNLHRN
jgi:hypothetical protein